MSLLRTTTCDALVVPSGKQSEAQAYYSVHFRGLSKVCITPSCITPSWQKKKKKVLTRLKAFKVLSWYAQSGCILIISVNVHQYLARWLYNGDKIKLQRVRQIMNINTIQMSHQRRGEWGGAYFLLLTVITKYQR